MSASLICGLIPAAAAADYQDMPAGWSRAAMEAAVENGLLQGYNGRLEPQEALTRAQMAAIVTRAFGAEKASDVSAYTDVPQGAWYGDAIEKAVYMGLLSGTSSTAMEPDRPITRQEAFVILARALNISGGDTAVLDQFADRDQVADWAEDAAAAMVRAGYAAGSNGYLMPEGTVTREQFAQMMHNAFKQYIRTPGTCDQIAAGSVMVSVPDVTLQNVTVFGDLVVGDGVGEGDVTLDSVTIEGRLLIRGGGTDSVHLVDSAVGVVCISKVDGNVRVAADDGSRMSEVYVLNDGENDVIIQGEVGNLTVSGGVPVVLRDATVDRVSVDASGASVSLEGETQVARVTTAADIEDVTLNAEKGTAIEELEASSEVTFTGEGRVESVTGSVTNEKGEAVKPDSARPSGGGGSSGGGGGSGSTHSHSWGEGVVTKPATCTEDGVRTYTCSCGQTKTEVIPAGHTWNEGTVTSEPTCTAAGEKTVACTVCGATQTETIPALGHDFTGAYLSDENDHWQKCARCDETGVHEAHSWDEGVVTKEPTPEESGTKELTCTVCGHQKTVELLYQTVAAVSGFAFTANASGIPQITFTLPDVQNVEGVGLELYDGSDWYEFVRFYYTESTYSYSLSDSKMSPGTYSKIRFTTYAEADSGFANNVYEADCSLAITERQGEPADLEVYDSSDGSIAYYNYRADLGTEENVPYSAYVSDEQNVLGIWHEIEGEAKGGIASFGCDKGGAGFWVLLKEYRDVTASGAACSYTVVQRGDWMDCTETDPEEMDSDIWFTMDEFGISFHWKAVDGAEYALSASQNGGDSWQELITTDGNTWMVTSLYSWMNCGVYDKARVIVTDPTSGEILDEYMEDIQLTITETNSLPPTSATYVYQSSDGELETYEETISGLKPYGTYSCAYSTTPSLDGEINNEYLWSYISYVGEDGVIYNDLKMPGLTEFLESGYYLIREYYDMFAYKTTASYTFDDHGGWTRCTQDDDEAGGETDHGPVAAVTDIAFDEYSVTWSKPLDANIAHYSVYFWEDGSSSWLQLGTVNSDRIYLDQFYTTGVYSKVKVVSVAADGSGYSDNETIADCRYEVRTDLFETAPEISFSPREGSSYYDYTISGLTPNAKGWLYLSYSTDSSSYNRFSFEVDRNGLAESFITSGEWLENGYYRIQEESFDWDGMTASHITQLTEWTKCME